MAKMYVDSVPTEQLQLAEELQMENRGIIRFLLTFAQLFTRK